MSAQLAPQPIFQAFAPAGGFLVGGKLFTYAAGTSTPQATYIDSTQTTQNTNPIILNAMGQAAVWLNPALGYKFVLQDASGNPVWSVDNVQNSGSAFFNSLTVGPPLSGTGAALTVNSAANWQAATMNSTLQLAGPNKLTNANQNVNLTQLMLHGQAAEMVWVNGSAGADLKVWSDFVDASGVLHRRIENDALSATADYMTVTRAGAFSGNQATITFPIGYGAVAINPTANAGQYQMAIFGGNVAGFANGLNIGAGSTTADNALNITNAANTKLWLNIRGDGLTTFGGNVRMGAPTTGNTLLATGGANAFAMQIQASLTAGQSKGLQLFAGTNNTDFLINGINAANSGNLFNVLGDGTTTIGGALGINGNVAPAQSTGWGTPTGNAIISAFPGASATLPQTSSVVAELIVLLKALGLLGT